MSGAPDAPGVPLDDADHTGRTRRAESARAVSSFAVRGTLRIAPAAEPARPALPEARARIQRFTIQGFKDPGFAISDQ
jgi:hypothetical protein